MKLVEMKCKNCGSILHADEGTTDIKCEYCHANYKLDDEVKHIKYDDMEQSGYEFEKGKIRAQEELRQKKIDEYNMIRNAQYEAQRKQKNLKWWILGWIFCFPIPLTVLIWKSKLEKKIKTILTVFLWGFILILGMTSPNDTTTNTLNSTDNVEENQSTTKEKYADDEIVNIFIKNFKSSSFMELTNIEQGNIRTKYFVKDNGVYVTLLNATENTANYFEIVINGSGNSDEVVNNIVEVYKEIAKALDSSLSDSKLDSTVATYIKPQEAPREFNLNDYIRVHYYPISGAGGYDCRIEIHTTQYNK